MTNIDAAIRRASGRPRLDFAHKKNHPSRLGVPPPLTFDLDALPGSTLLTNKETAAAIRASRAALKLWRKRPDHPLRWRRTRGRYFYELSSIREFLKGEK
jgi:hypothetical protein